MNKQLIAKLAMLALAAVGTAAHAEVDSSATFLVKIQITKTCAVSSTPNDIDLGSVDVTADPVSQTGSTSFQVNCSKNTPFYIGLAPSVANGGGTDGTGYMASVTNTSTDKVPYALYSDAGYATPWGNTATTTNAGNGMPGTGQGMAPANALTFNVYAKATNVDFTPDNYADTVTVNVNY